MLKYKLTAISFFFTQMLLSQVNVKGILLKSVDNYKKGDTVVVNACHNNDNYVVKTESYDRIIPLNKIKIITHLNYWDELWLKTMSLEIYKNGFDNLTRKNLEQKFQETLTEYETNNAFFIDVFTEDYLQQLVLKIHPGPLHKGKPTLLNIRILKSTLPEVHSYDNGTILLTTGFLASCESEYDLVKKLILEIAKIELDYHVSMEKNLLMVKTEKEIAEVLQNFLNQPEFGKKVYRNRKQFFITLSNVISFSAQQNYFAKNYPEGLNCINKLTEADLMSEDDYLVAARLTRLTGNTYESNQKALEYLKKSVGEAGGNNLMDIQAEYGLIYLRLGKPEEALASFEKYKRSLESLPDKSNNIEEIKWAESMIRKCQLL